MKSLTIHKIEESLLVLLREKAQSENKSINQTVKELIEEKVGVKKMIRTKPSEFSDLCGSWSKKDLAEFEVAVKEFEKIDEDDWKE